MKNFHDESINNPKSEIRNPKLSDVLISGAGPVGMSLALALVKNSVSVVVLEQLSELSHEARASTFHPPTLEFFAEIGVIDEVLASGLKIESLQFWERANRELVADFPYSLIEKDTPYPFRFQCPQSQVTRIILPHIQNSPIGEVLFNHKFASFSQDAESIFATAETPTGEAYFRAKYLIGGDGAFSKVREGLNLNFTGKTYEDRFLLISSDINLKPFFPEMGTVAYIFDPEEWVIVMTLPDAVRIVFRLNAEEDADFAKREENVRKRIVKFLQADVNYSIKGISTYHVHQRIAETFRVGRAILAGDAAHINNPTGGMGMNSGIHDAQMLAKALVAVLKENTDEKILDEYAETRRRVATEMVQATTDKNYREMAANDEALREKRNRELREAAADTQKARAYLLKTAMLADRI